MYNPELPNRKMQAFAKKWDAKMNKYYSKEIAYSKTKSKIYPDRDMYIMEGAEPLKSGDWVKQINIFPKSIEYQVLVMNKDSVGAVMDVPEERIAVLNFASYIYAGGGYTIGSMTQEDMLCYASDLYQVLSRRSDYYEHRMIGEEDTDRSLLWTERGDERYRDLYHSDLLYTPDILFFKDEMKRKADVITCAAPNVTGLLYGLGFYRSKLLEQRDKENLVAMIDKTLRSRIVHILGAAYDNDVHTLILGAWGCGAFGNDPYMVARAFKDCIKEYGCHGTVENYIFAVPDFSKEGKSNFDVFFEVMQDMW